MFYIFCQTKLLQSFCVSPLRYSCIDIQLSPVSRGQTLLVHIRALLSQRNTNITYFVDLVFRMCQVYELKMVL